jgi:rhodanese-related sulfurtransferase
MSMIHVLALAVLLASNEARRTVEFTKDSLEVVQKNVAEKKAVLVDVRSPMEWNKGHIEGAVFLPVDALRRAVDPKKLAKVVPKKKIVYTFCVVGMRAKAAALKLQQHGYTVRALKPGYEQLLEAGFKKGETKKEAQVPDIGVKSRAT